MKLQATFERGNHVAKVYRDTEWNEWRVRFWYCKVYLNEADYHTDDREDAMDTAMLILERQAMRDSRPTF